MLTPSPVERWLFRAVRDATPDAAVPALRGVAGLGGHRFVWPLVSAAGLVACRRTGRAADLLVSLGCLACTVAARRGVAELYRRGRPDAGYWRAAATGYCCPSRHTIVATVGWGVAAS